MNTVFDAKTSKQLFVIALLRAADADIKNRDLKFAYETSYLSEMYPGISLSENTVSKFLLETGMAYRYIHKFMEKRVNEFAGHTLVVDGTLKSNNSVCNMFSEFSRKGHIKSSKDLNLIYAYDVDAQEPVAVKPYPGNMLDLSAIEDFVTGYAISSGLLVMDKGFYSKSNIEKLRAIDGLTYIIPLKQSSKLIDDNNMLDAIVSPLDGYSDASVIISLRVKKILKTTPLSSNKKSGVVKMISDEYSYRQVMRYLSKCKMVRVGDSDKWVPCQTVKYVSELTHLLGV